MTNHVHPLDRDLCQEHRMMATESPKEALQRRLLLELSPLMARHGFVLRQSRQAFERAFAKGRSSFHLSFIPHEKDFDVTADVAVRVDAVENLVHEDNRRISASERRNTFSIGAEVGNISNGRQKRWTIRTDNDVTIAAIDIFHTFEAIGLPYIQRYSNLDAILGVLARNDPAGWLHAPSHPWRCMKAVALAFVMDKYSDINSLIEQSRRFLKTSGSEVDRIRFDEFAQKILSKQKH